MVVPRQNLLGDLNRGWPITQGSLAHERGMLWIGNASNIEGGVNQLVDLGRVLGLAGDSRFCDQAASLYIDSQAVKLMGYRGFAKFARGQPATEHALLKLFSSETEQRLYLTGMETLGADGTDIDRPGPMGWREGSWATQYLRSFAGTIAGGTSEIQRNIIAERVLGLPRK